MHSSLAEKKVGVEISQSSEVRKWATRQCWPRSCGDLDQCYSNRFLTQVLQLMGGALSLLTHSLRNQIYSQLGLIPQSALARVFFILWKRMLWVKAEAVLNNLVSVCSRLCCALTWRRKELVPPLASSLPIIRNSSTKSWTVMRLTWAHKLRAQLTVLKSHTHWTQERPWQGETMKSHGNQVLSLFQLVLCTFYNICPWPPVKMTSAEWIVWQKMHIIIQQPCSKY